MHLLVHSISYSISLFYSMTTQACGGTAGDFTRVPFHLDLFSASLAAKSVSIHSITLLHSERPKGYEVLAILSGIGLILFPYLLFFLPLLLFFLSLCSVLLSLLSQKTYRYGKPTLVSIFLNKDRNIRYPNF